MSCVSVCVRTLPLNSIDMHVYFSAHGGIMDLWILFMSADIWMGLAHVCQRKRSEHAHVFAALRVGQ